MSSDELQINIDDDEELYLQVLFKESDELPTASNENDDSGAALPTVYHQGQAGASWTAAPFSAPHDLVNILARLDRLENRVDILEEENRALKEDWNDVEKVKHQHQLLIKANEVKRLERINKMLVPKPGPMPRKFTESFYNFRNSSNKLKTLEPAYISAKMRAFGFPSDLLDMGNGVANNVYYACNLLYHLKNARKGIDRELPEECAVIDCLPADAYKYLEYLNPALGKWLKVNGGTSFFTFDRSLALPDSLQPCTFSKKFKAKAKATIDLRKKIEARRKEGNPNTDGLQFTDVRDSDICELVKLNTFQEKAEWAIKRSIRSLKSRFGKYPPENASEMLRDGMVQGLQQFGLYDQSSSWLSDLLKRSLEENTPQPTKRPSVKDRLSLGSKPSSSKSKSFHTKSDSTSVSSSKNSYLTCKNSKKTTPSNSTSSNSTSNNSTSNSSSKSYSSKTYSSKTYYSKSYSSKSYISKSS